MRMNLIKLLIFECNFLWIKLVYIMYISKFPQIPKNKMNQKTQNPC